MAQVFHVVRCFACQSFQVQQVKKGKKWSCKLCGKKQSLLKEFGRGSGADCRHHVQKLNAMRGAIMEEQDNWSLRKQMEAENEEQKDDQERHDQVSRWSKYMDTPEEEEEEEEEEEDEKNILMNSQPFQAEYRINRKRKRTDKGNDHWSPEQSKSSLTTKPGISVFKPESTRTTCLHRTRPPCPKNTSPSSPKSTTTIGLHRTSAPSQSSGSRWACYLSADCQEEAGPIVSGSGQVDRAAALSYIDNINHVPPFTRRTPMLPGSSMFESGDDFNFDDTFGSF